MDVITYKVTDCDTLEVVGEFETFDSAMVLVDELDAVGRDAVVVSCSNPKRHRFEQWVQAQAPACKGKSQIYRES